MQSKIITELKNLGLNGEFLDEMTDHYCAAFEAQLDAGANIDQALLSVCNQIQLAKLDKTQRQLFFIKNKNKIAVSMGTFILLVFTFFSSSNFPVYESNEMNSYLLEVGADSLVFGKVLDGSPEVTSHFGMRFHPILKKKIKHKGIDLKGIIGDPVYAPADGIVSEVGYHQKKGNFIEINHADGITSRYFHLSKITVKKDASIEKGIQIGEVGVSGAALAPHLHFEILKKETQLNPVDFLRV